MCESRSILPDACREEPEMLDDGAFWFGLVTGFLAACVAFLGWVAGWFDILEDLL